MAFAADQLMSSGLNSAIVQVIEKWVATTKNGDLEGRIALYSDRLDIFYTKPNLSKANVEQEIRRMINNYSSFPVLELSNVTWRELRAGVVQVEFDKDYVANKRAGGSVAGRVRSMLTLVRTGQSWSIIGERDLKVYPKPQSSVMASVTVEQKNLRVLQKVRHVIVASMHQNDLADPLDDFSAAVSADFVLEIAEQIEQYTCFKVVKPGDAPLDNDHFPGYALLMTDADVAPLGGLFGAPGWQLFYNVSLTNPEGTLWDGGTIVFVHGPVNDQSSKPDTVLAAVNILKALAKDACPK
jgi:ketosteroid isomerase-like protein